MAHRQPTPAVQPRRRAPLAAQRPARHRRGRSSLARRQRTTQAVMVAAQALREGDRPAAGAAPDLKDKS